MRQRQAWRDDYLVALYDLSGGSLMEWPRLREIAERAGIPLDEVDPIGELASSESFAEFKTTGGVDGLIAITSYGIRRAEEIVEERERAGRPVISGLLVFSDQELRQELEKLVATLRTMLDDAELEPDIKADATSDLESATDQLRAATPNRGVIRASLERIRNKVGGVTLYTATVIPAVDVVLHRLGL
jgi:hypothetical protein